MFRDSRGVVHTVSSSDPLDDLPAGAAKALQRALLRPDEADLGSALERCDAVRELVERWQDAFFASLPPHVDLDEERRWAAEAGLSLDDVEAGYEEDGLDLDLSGLDLEDLDAAEDDDDEDDDELEELAELVSRGGAPADDDPRRLLPDDLVAVLERELLLLPLRVRLEALVAAGDVVSQWSDLLADHEKLLGHLVLAHAVALDTAPGVGAGDGAPLGHEQLAARHAELHADGGPAHPAAR